MPPKKQRNPPLKETVNRTDKDFDEPIGLTLQYCCLEIYENSNDYNGKTGQQIIDLIKKESIGKYSFTIIFHDCDYYNENTFDKNRNLVGIKGKKKANHYHVVLGFRYRVKLSDISQKFGIADRFIKKLKKEIDYDNMLVYLTHIKYAENVKHHYPINAIDSNIFDYNLYLYDKALSEIEQNTNNIINEVYTILQTNKSKRFKTSDMYQSITLKGYGINEFNKYYRIIRDMITEHNQDLGARDDSKATRMMLHQTQRKLDDALQNVNVLATENMKLRGINVEDEKGEIFK